MGGKENDLGDKSVSICKIATNVLRLLHTIPR